MTATILHDQVRHTEAPQPLPQQPMAVACSALLASTRLMGRKKFAGPSKPCKHCGYSPVRIDTTFVNGNKAFQFACPNEECWANKHNMASVLMPSRREAALAWDAANAG